VDGPQVASCGLGLFLCPGGKCRSPWAVWIAWECLQTQYVGKEIET